MGDRLRLGSIELFGSRDRRLRASSLNSLYFFLFVENIYPPFAFYGILLYSMKVL